MTIRYRAASVASVALVVGLSLAAGGCGKYSLSTIKAFKAFKDGNTYYQQKDFKRAAERYEEVVAHPDAIQTEPRLAPAYFFLANSYDQMYKPAKQGEAQNDAYIQKAVEYYRQAADKNTEKQWKQSSLDYLAAAYGPDKLNDPEKAAPIYQEMIKLDPSDPKNYGALAKLYEDAGRYDEAEKTLLDAQQAKPNDVAVYTMLANYYNRQGDFPKTIDALQKAADLNPKDPEGYHRIAVFYWDKANKDFRLSLNDKRDYILKGVAMEDKALGLNPDYMEAMTYKNILLRLQANTEKDPAKQKDLIDQADKLRNKVMDMQKRKQTGKG
jgi:tetratricopeptide (TPR) repeat protein